MAAFEPIMLDAFEPNNLVPGIGASPGKQLPVNAPQVPVHSYSNDGAMRYIKVSDPLYAPNSKGGARRRRTLRRTSRVWQSDGDMVRSAYTLHAADDD